ncbi:hypothetical protein CABS01_12530, partial [Colletotrichum abscissum]|uniref:uncharacterized protein n=1 Tax=Colletotrichum abscissum TaxID=1671311 RepID=UPI0027D4B523
VVLDSISWFLPTSFSFVSVASAAVKTFLSLYRLFLGFLQGITHAYVYCSLMKVNGWIDGE